MCEVAGYSAVGMANKHQCNRPVDVAAADGDDGGSEGRSMLFRDAVQNLFS